MTVPSWQQPDSSGWIPASRLPVTQQNWRISGAASGLESHRIPGQSRSNWDKFSPTSHRKPSFYQYCTNAAALIWSELPFLGRLLEKHEMANQKVKQGKFQFTFMLTQQYLANYHPCSDFTVWCCYFMCTFNCDNVTIQSELLRPTSSTVQDHITFRLTLQSGLYDTWPAKMQNISLTENSGVEIYVFTYQTGQFPVYSIPNVLPTSTPKTQLKEKKPEVTPSSLCCHWKKFY